MYARTHLARAAALLALLLAACDAGKPAAAPLPLTIAVTLQPVAALVYVAEAKGYFREEGIAATFSDFYLGRDALASALDGRSDLATVYDTPIVLRLAEGKDIAVLTTLHHSVNSHAVLARRDRGIARPADLRGKRIGVTKGISTDYFLSVFLTSEGIPAAAVTEVPLEPENYEKALAGGTVDALVTFNPLTFKLRDALGAERLAIFHSDLYREASVLAGRREVVAAKREAVTRALRAIVRAEDYLRDRPEDAQRIVVARLSGWYPEAVVREGWKAFRAEARLDNMLLTQLVQQGYWLREREGRQAPPPDFERALTAEYLEAVRPRAVTVLHGAR